MYNNSDNNIRTYNSIIFSYEMWCRFTVVSVIILYVFRVVRVQMVAIGSNVPCVLINIILFFVTLFRTCYDSYSNKQNFIFKSTTLHLGVTAKTVCARFNIFCMKWNCSSTLLMPYLYLISCGSFAYSNNIINFV